MSRGVARKLQLVEATVQEVGTAGSLNVTVGQIAKRAGVSPALAFHYFGDKDALFIGAMRHILSLYGSEVRLALQNSTTPMERILAVIGPNFTADNFRPEIISAWLNFYVLAQSNPQARRLLYLYHRRLNSNLTHAFRPFLEDRAPDAATRIAALIDGLYLRMIIQSQSLAPNEAEAMVLSALQSEIKGAQSEP